jgi:hypothetical protein
MFDYSLSRSRYQTTTEWSAKQNTYQRRQIKYPFLIECTYVDEMDNMNGDEQRKSNAKRRKIFY